MNFSSEMKKRVTEIKSIIERNLPEEEGFQRTLLEAVNYSMLVGGKKLRPLLMQQTYAMFGGRSKAIEPFMTAIEMIHTHSLIHDDLPAMDNDEYRRGKKTTKKFWKVTVASVRLSRRTFTCSFASIA